MAPVVFPGQTISGDRHLVRAQSDRVLVAVVDGLGHGAEAAVAANVAVTTLEAHIVEPVTLLLKRCSAQNFQQSRQALGLEFQRLTALVKNSAQQQEVEQVRYLVERDLDELQRSITTASSWARLP